MTTKAEAARYRAAAGARATTAGPAGTTAAAAPRTTVRMTLDLTPEQRRTLARYASEIGVEIDRPRLGSAEVLRAIIDVLEAPEDPDTEGALSERARNLLRSVVVDGLGGGDAE